MTLQIYIDINSRSITNKVSDCLFIQASYQPLLIALSLSLSLSLSLKSGFQMIFPIVFSLSNYNIYRHDRTSQGGRVFLAVPITLQSCLVTTEEDNMEILVVDIKLLNTSKLPIICCYIPPNSSNDSNAKFIANLSNIIKIDAGYVIVGDCNLPLVYWNNFLFPTNNGYKFLVKFFKQNEPMSQLISWFPTRGTNSLDLGFTNNEQFFKVLESWPPLKSSEHWIIQLQMITSIPTRNNQKRSFWKRNNESIAKTISNVISPDFDHCSVDKIWNTFYSKISTATSQYVPMKSITCTHLSRWMTRALKRLYNKVKRAKKKLNQQPELQCVRWQFAIPAQHSSKSNDRGDIMILNINSSSYSPFLSLAWPVD